MRALLVGTGLHPVEGAPKPQQFVGTHLKSGGHKGHGLWAGGLGRFIVLGLGSEPAGQGLLPIVGMEMGQLHLHQHRAFRDVFARRHGSQGNLPAQDLRHLGCHIAQITDGDELPQSKGALF